MKLDKQFIVHRINVSDGDFQDRITESYDSPSDAQAEAERLAKVYAVSGDNFEVLRCRKVSESEICVTTTHVNT